MILTIDHGEVREIRMNRPPVNALTGNLLRDLRLAIQAATQSRALILSGLPGKFCAGLDLPFLLTQDRDAIASLWRELYAAVQAIACSPIPIAAAITGHAPAGGTVLSMFCDWRVMADGDFRLGLNEVQVGIPLPKIAFVGLRRLVGERQAERLGVEGKMITAKDALQIGLVDELTPLDQVIPRALGWCTGLLSLPSEAMLITRREARADLLSYFERGLAPEIEAAIASWWTPEAQKTMTAVVNRMKSKKAAQ